MSEDKNNNTNKPKKSKKTLKLEPKSKLEIIEKRELGVTMMKAGFKNNIIEIATGLSNNMIRVLREELSKKEGEDYESNSYGQLRISSRIVDNRRRLIDGGILLEAYLKMAENADRIVDYENLMRAHGFYMEAHLDVYGNMVQPLDINEAYVLVRDYRSKDGSILLHRCSCGSNYITVVDQRISYGCPICSMDDGNKDEESISAVKAN